MGGEEPALYDGGAAAGKLDGPVVEAEESRQLAGEEDVGHLDLPPPSPGHQVMDVDLDEELFEELPQPGVSAPVAALANIVFSTQVLKVSSIAAVA